jgi:hypothetical protein
MAEAGMAEAGMAEAGMAEAGNTDPAGWAGWGAAMAWPARWPAVWPPGSSGRWSCSGCIRIALP